MKITKFIAVLAAAVVMPVAANAQACTAATQITGLAGYLRCQGSYVGNLNGSASELTQLSSLFGRTWRYDGSSTDTNFGPFTSNPNQASSGTLTFDGPQTGLFVLGIKAANRFSFYMFDGGVSGMASIPFSTKGTATNKRLIAQNLSHSVLYEDATVVLQSPVPKASTFEAPTIPVQSIVPEPSTYALIAAGLVGIIVAARRRRA